MMLDFMTECVWLIKKMSQNKWFNKSIKKIIRVCNTYNNYHIHFSDTKNREKTYYSEDVPRLRNDFRDEISVIKIKLLPKPVDKLFIRLNKNVSKHIIVMAIKLYLISDFSIIYLPTLNIRARKYVLLVICLPIAMYFIRTIFIVVLRNYFEYSIK